MSNAEEDPLAWVKRLSELGIILGGGLALEHVVSYNHWYDEDKDECHGKFGLALAILSGFTRFICALLEPPKCIYCGNRLTYISESKQYYCWNCRKYV